MNKKDVAAISREVSDFYGQYWTESAIDLEVSRKYLKKIINIDDIRGKRILDAGCGTGCNSLVLFNDYSAREVFGIDISEKCIQRASRIKSELLKDEKAIVSFQQGDVLAPPFEDGYFDTVISSGVIHHTRDIREAFRNLTAKLKNGGVFYLGVVRRTWYYPFFVVVNSVTRAMPKILQDILIAVFSFIYVVVNIFERKQHLAPISVFQRVKDALLVPRIHFLSEKEIFGMFEANGYENTAKIGYFGLFGNIIVIKGQKAG